MYQDFYYLSKQNPSLNESASKIKWIKFCH